LTNQENKERKEGVEVKFNQIFAENWKETETTLNKLQTEIEIYQQTFLQANQEHQTQIEILPK
jgi:hypothetical protein